MPAVARLDTVIKYLVLAFAAVMGFSRGGIHTVVWLLIVAAAIRFCLRPFPIPLDKDLKRAMLLFFGALALATLFSSDIAASLKFLGLSVVKILPFFIVVAFIKERKVAEQATILMAGSILIGAAIVIWQGLHDPGRIKGTLGVMDFAGIVGMLVPVLLIKGFEETVGKFARPLFLVAAFMSMVAMIFNGTKAGWVTVFVACVFYLIINLLLNRKKSFRAAALICVMLLIISLIFASSPRLMTRLYTVVDPTYGSNHDRIVMWQYAINVFKDNWIVGVGPATLPELPLSPQHALELQKNPKSGHVHNNLLQIGAESGIGGVLGYISIFGVILINAFRNLRQLKKKSWAMISLLCTTSFLIHGLFDYTFNIPTIMYGYWFILGLAYINLSPET